MKLKPILLAGALAAFAVPAVTVAAESGTTEKKSEAGQYLADSAITTKVKTALLAEKNLKSLDINVETQNGTVQLAGFVTSSAQKDQAEDITKRVKGVKEVKNDLRLKTDTQG